MNEIPTNKQITTMTFTCEDCYHKKNNDDGGFCYMFEEKNPLIMGTCGQFKPCD